MIQPNELRIGNWVTTFESQTPIKLDHNIFANDVCRYAAQDLNPIPLTTEILEKAGFEFNGKLYVINENKYHIFSILFGEICYPYIRTNHHEISEHFSLYGIKHLHQLQNLYFALTGEELNITL